MTTISSCNQESTKLNINGHWFLCADKDLNINDTLIFQKDSCFVSGSLSTINQRKWFFKKNQEVKTILNSDNGYAEIQGNYKWQVLDSLLQFQSLHKNIIYHQFKILELTKNQLKLIVLKK